MSKRSSKRAQLAKRAKPKIVDVFQILRDLKPEEHFEKPPAPFAGDLYFARSNACFALWRYGVLRDGVLNIYVNKQNVEKNKPWRSVPLERSTISYRKRDKRILFEMAQRYRMQVRKNQFKSWVDHLRAHRMYAQAKARSHETEKVPESTVPIESIATEPCESTVPASEAPAENPEEPLEAPAQVQVPIIVAASLPEPGIAFKKVQPRLQTAVPVPVTLLAPKKDQATNESSGGQQLKSTEKTQRPVKAPVPVAVEVIRKEPEPDIPIVQPSPAKKAAISSNKENKEEVHDGSDDSGSADHFDQPSSLSLFRTKLPSPMNPAPSLFKLIMSAIGRDVMRTALPASVMEPLGTLQVLCEELENSSLIDRALSQSDPVLRMAFIAAFAVSRYGSTARRAGRKPFNPLLAETFEFVHPSNGWRFLAEQVSHHPAVSACFAEGKGWQYWQDCELVASLSMTAVKATPVGLIYLRFEKSGETYVWNKVQTQVTGIFSGTYTIDHIGEMTIACKETKLKCKLNFKLMPVGRRGDVDGQVMDETGKGLKRVYGNWTENFFVGAPNDPKHTRIWHLAEMPQDYERYYGFTRFALALNEIRNDIHGTLPKTDSRLRPDQKALEMGKPDDADKIKRDLEERQRARRKANEAEQHSHTPLWFRETGNKNPAVGPRWEFNGKYWQAKKEHFSGVEFVDLW